LSTQYATGRRKNAIAKVWISAGSGSITVNDSDIKEYFPRGTHRDHIMQVLEACGMVSKIDIVAKVSSGGKTGQSGAIRMGLARCLAKLDETIKATMSKGGFLTRDSRMVERKKYGKMKARRSYQFSKR
jgi:small subunit ribosomal protein S9